MSFLADTHCHLNLNSFQEDLPGVLERARQKNVRRILVPGIDLEGSRAAVALAESHAEVYAAVGIHPHDALSWRDDTLAALRALAAHPKVVAIGEIGLDYYRDRSPRDLQALAFRSQLRLAAELGLPVVIHNREAFTDLWAELETWLGGLQASGAALLQRPGVLHSFDGDLEMGRKAVQKGFYIGISGPVTYKNAPLRCQAAASLALDHLLLETDAPYLTPHPYRGRRNEPAYVALVAEKIAALRDLPPDGDSLLFTRQVTWENAEKLFHWGVSL